LNRKKVFYFGLFSLISWGIINRLAARLIKLDKGVTMFYAHSENVRREKHILKEHLLSTAKLARSFSPSEKLKQLFYLAGILHDVGKYQEGFQKYLEFGKPKTPHASIGSYIARKLLKHYLPLPFVIKGHHAGMPDKSELQSTIAEYTEDEDTVKIVCGRFLIDFPEFLSAYNNPSNRFRENDRLIEECTSRLLFSALTDADWLDTERHFDSDKSNTRLTTELQLDLLINALENKFSQLPVEGKINQLRTKARTEVKSHFANSPGFFSLQLPTGLGKTLTSMYWALKHAQINNLKRIIIVLPYINIIDQTASILKKVFGDEVVLEHHSGIIEDDEQYSDEKYEKEQPTSKQLACENWQSPIIVTTAVQFFESLFSNRPSKCRKNHSIGDSVVIFDEIQTLPKHLAEPTIIMLKNIASIARTSFLFCTATMPAFEKRDKFDGIDETTSLIKNPKKYFDATQRVNFKLIKKLNPITVDEVSKNLLKETKSYMVIINTKAVAKEIYGKVKEGNTHEQYYHLSTAMCPHHRKKRINEIIADLDSRNKRKIAVVSTQLVEAGVDFDFPVVYRAIAPLDAIIQAAGRCNRNGMMRKGKVVLFDLLNHRMPDSTYRSCADFAKGVIKDNPEVLHKAKSFERYYEQVIDLFINPDRFGITEERKSFNFKTVDGQYQIIEKGRTAPILIADYSTVSKALLKDSTELFNRTGFISKEQYRNLQQYSVQVYHNFLYKYKDQIETHESGLRIWHGKYDLELGIMPEDVETVF
jgi:CRISPR-associated endonuclease/helicase Cas3